LLKSREGEMERGEVGWVEEVAEAEIEKVKDGVVAKMEDPSALFATGIIEISKHCPITMLAVACCQQSAHVYS
jgi:hypothetical protein